MSQPEKPQLITVSVGLRPGFSLALRLSCIIAIGLAWFSPAAASAFVDYAIRGLTRCFVSIR